jgi:hypothetical protein
MSVTLHIHETGEIKQVALSGVDRTEPWTQTPLEALLRLVPDLVDAVDRAEMGGRDVVITVKEHNR